MPLLGELYESKKGIRVRWITSEAFERRWHDSVRITSETVEQRF